jgi:hypothetical protein
MASNQKFRSVDGLSGGRATPKPGSFLVHFSGDNNTSNWRRRNWKPREGRRKGRPLRPIGLSNQSLRRRAFLVFEGVREDQYKTCVS